MLKYPFLSTPILNLPCPLLTDPFAGLVFPSSKRLMVEYSIGCFETESKTVPEIPPENDSLAGDCEEACNAKKRKQIVRIRLKSMINSSYIPALQNCRVLFSW